ncbi:NAD-dependent epimerase/dehydratase family protein [Flavobacterium psychrophilum]|uniref:NAD-dependent epimerase/dehydratase family protein n=1 Tax=Flavobacterium psychrophilum TaxID=96345 RepID=UPI000B7C0894|nr:NAD-dependent epimerase/dehydratase family protein [Flavobacterium psychrophilum]EKT4498936.1 NAD-dependent epimerase/dehydratase family protein [Flavobacterium psychrophilum]ELM3650600.1 NAD-dependent epimerase/dehydratase family protein [Flavobacterium psychrophilum]ELM3671730.1 NAD-dependent epimerase/dehydratase family protein [Flavobacterium psychrophilum]ELM3726100.1 NAD-dependent epimerase/dehydratase family protein [Flavobacterium psychrophilum]ELY1991642.1 NAD-dependent epimerase/d
MVLVTGATGLVGSHLVLHLLEQGESVKALFRNENGKQKVKAVFDYYNQQELFAKIHWYQADVLDIPSLEGAFHDVNYVYHCAALISFDPKDEGNLRKINIEGTQNIISFCIDFKIKKLCYVSSIAALGDLAPQETIVTETCEWNPEMQHSDYAISKYGAEMEVWRAQQEGLDVVVVNPGVILGPLFWTEGSGEIYTKVHNGLPFYTKGSTGFVSVIDVVTILLLLMKSDIVNEKFILISENKTYQELVFAIAETLNTKKPKLYASKFLTSFAWRTDWFFGAFFGKKRTLTKDLASTLHAKEVYCNRKIITQIDYKFLEVSVYLKAIKKASS